LRWSPAGKSETIHVDGDSLVNLTGHVKDGILQWDVPPGDWRIMKFTWEFKARAAVSSR
jgi:hypothetical protein